MGRRSRSERLFACDECGAEFRWGRNLAQHKRAEHPKAYICAECGRAYRQEHCLRDHERRVHAEAVYPCTHAGCESVFAKKSSLMMHIRTALMRS